jgi:hypothetical protein
MECSYSPTIIQIEDVDCDILDDRHERSPIPIGKYINAQMWYSSGADTGGEYHTRITEHIKTAEAKFLSCDRSFTIRNVWNNTYATLDIILKAEDIDLAEPLPDEAISLCCKMMKTFPEINLLVAFIAGDFFKSNGAATRVVGRATTVSVLGKLLYFVLLTNQASPELLAHELGHVLNFSNKDGTANDPNPLPNDPGHNADPGNLMFPTPALGAVITPAQCEQFYESRIILDR